MDAIVKRDVSNVVSTNANQGLPIRKRKNPKMINIIIFLGIDCEKFKNLCEFAESIIEFNKKRIIITIKYSSTYYFFI